jgi:hypothetical protein
MYLYEFYLDENNHFKMGIGVDFYLNHLELAVSFAVWAVLS